MKKIFLFQGDSITDGGRTRDDAASLGRGYPALIAAEIGYRMGSASPTFYNRGVAGDRVSDLYARWNEDAIYLRPDAISMLVGVNDAWRIREKLPSGVTDRFERAYRHLLEETREALPGAELVLCEPFGLPVGKFEQGWEEWRGHLERYGLIVRELADRHGATFVPLQRAFDEAAGRADGHHWLYDGVHPTPAGHELIKTVWLKAVRGSVMADWFGEASRHFL